jgi:alkylated DNA repair dioxygenase AlkB
VNQTQLFAAPRALPEGFEYRAEFLDRAQEHELLAQIRLLPLQEAQYKAWQARRRVVSFGGRYDYSRNVLTPAPPIPPFLYALRERLAAWAGVAVAGLEHALIAEYRPQTPLGWHRDVPQFEVVIGISLLGDARLRFRPWPPGPGQRTVCAVALAPRSVYLLRGVARWQWQHALSPTKELRYSITFRTRAARHAARTG